MYCEIERCRDIGGMRPVYVYRYSRVTLTSIILTLLMSRPEGIDLIMDEVAEREKLRCSQEK